jgi:hypothetical protein
MSDARRGVAYPFWEAVVEAQSAHGISDVELHKLSGVARSTLDRLKVGTRPPHVTTINKLVAALHLDRDLSLQQAGLKPAAMPQGEVDVRAAIEGDPAFTAEQRATLLHMVDAFRQVNQSGRKRP